jgi:large subunit ribosomal protein L4
MKVDIYNQQGKKTGEISLPEEIFAVEMNQDLVHQVAVSLMANKREGSAKAKDRSEVRGGGKKPWRQKGTGRARHGSRRSPIWRGGGVTFGPTGERNFEKKINRKMRRKALLMVLSEKVRSNLIVVLEDLKLSAAKTKQLAKIIESLPLEKKSCLIALPGLEKDIVTAGKNIPAIRIEEARNLNVLDMLSFKYLVMPKGSIEEIEKNFSK